jgi:hypothetical protein
MSHTVILIPLLGSGLPNEYLRTRIWSATPVDDLILNYGTKTKRIVNDVMHLMFGGL